MGAWRALADIAGCVVPGALLVVLAWAANERGRMHHVAGLHRMLRKDAASLLACRSIATGSPSRPGGVGTVTTPMPDVPKGELL